MLRRVLYGIFHHGWAGRCHLAFGATGHRALIMGKGRWFKRPLTKSVPTAIDS
ncbi:hypothetical protein [Brevibacillus centrosporus]|uniref:hypothetical protein n=1 Tax=Brevibacillus centrosporus TaxID=54910 RepID=UPI0039883304